MKLVTVVSIVYSTTYCLYCYFTGSIGRTKFLFQVEEALICK